MHVVDFGLTHCAGCGTKVLKRSRNHRFCGFRCRYYALYQARPRPGLQPPSARMLRVVAASQRGLTTRAIARLEGISHQRVSQMLQRARGRGWLDATMVESQP